MLPHTSLSGTDGNLWLPAKCSRAFHFFCAAAQKKWNPIDHRLFSFVSINWAGRPLDSFETVLNYLRSTTTSKALRVAATLLSGTYKSGVKVSKQEMEALNLTRATELPQWNYTLRPTAKASTSAADMPETADS